VLTNESITESVLHAYHVHLVPFHQPAFRALRPLPHAPKSKIHHPFRPDPAVFPLH
jgi:hypothetical protein